MNTGKVVLKSFSLDFRKTVVFVKNNHEYISLIILFVCGLIFGTVLVYNSDNYRYFFSLFTDGNSDFNRLFINGIFEIFIVLTVNFSMGLCLVGTPFICMLSVLEGIYIASVYTLHLHNFGYESIISFIFNDLLFHIVIYVLFSISQFFSVSMSQSLKQYFSDRKTSLSVRQYLISYLVIIIIAIVVVFIKSAIKCFV